MSLLTAAEFEQDMVSDGYEVVNQVEEFSNTYHKVFRRGSRRLELYTSDPTQPLTGLLFPSHGVH